MMINQTIRFIVVGILNTVVGFSVYYICFDLMKINYSLSLVISHIIGVINSYFWNKKWTFNITKASKGMVIKFGLIYLSTFIINYGILVLFVEIFLFNPIISQLFSMIVTTLINFVGQKYWSFKVNTLESEK